MTRPVIIMAAPNGSRWSQSDHPNLPQTIPEITSECLKCYHEGASIVHVHVRDQHGKHTLDTGLYKELVAEISKNIPDLLIQITTEAVGLYTPEQQRNVIQSVQPDMVSIALKEMIPDKNYEALSSHFYHWAADENIHVQHILYDIKDIEYYQHLKETRVIPEHPSAILFVLGRYSEKLLANHKDLENALEHIQKTNMAWFCCAFGATENRCIEKAIKSGGHARIGFENNFLLASGKVAAGTYETVQETFKTIHKIGLEVASVTQTKQILFSK